MCITSLSSFISLNMANLLLINILPKRVAVILIKLQNTIKKLHNTASSITFIKKVLCYTCICKS